MNAPIIATGIVTNPETDQLRACWDALRDADPRLRIRDAAQRLGCSEAQLVALGCGAGAVRLRGPWPALVAGLEALGELLALTRNEHAVHEKTGRYRDISVDGDVGLVRGDGVDLRLLYAHWHLGFAVTEPGPQGERHSLQFFDVDGTAVHKVYLTGHSDREAYAALVARHRHADQGAAQTVYAQPPGPAPRGDAEIDVAGLRAHWAALRDPHDFNAMLRRFQVGRAQALALVGAPYAVPAIPGDLRRVLDHCAAQAMPLRVFVASPGAVQIHTGPIDKRLATGPWYNVLDPAFNLHVRETGLAEAWVVRKPSARGEVISLELFDARREPVLMLFDAQPAGTRGAWAELLDGPGPAGDEVRGAAPEADAESAA